MLTDYHCHILSGMDDGSESLQMSLEMLEIMKSYGTERVVATSHFYAHREGSVRHFLVKRDRAYEKLAEAKPVIQNIHLGAEVAIEKDLSELGGLEKLTIQGTNLILLELPYSAFSDWMVEEIESIASVYKLTPIIAHVHRYLPYYSKSDFEKILQTDAIFQINAEAFGGFRESRFVKKLIESEFPLVFGSDAHNLSNRRPNLDKAVKGLRKYEHVAEQSDGVLDRYVL